MSTIELLKTKYPSFLKAKVAGVNNDRIVLPAGRMLWPALFTAVKPSKGETNPKKFQYSMSLLIPAEADISALRDMVQALFEENVPEKQRKGYKWRNPIENTADTTSAAMADEYPYLLKPNSKQWQKNGVERKRPDVFDAKRAPIVADPGPEAIYHGRWGQVVVNPYWYPPNEGMAGVSLGMLSTQLLWHDKDDTPIHGGNVDTSGDFEVVEGLDETPEVDEYA